MSTVRAVRDHEEDPKKGKPRATSGVSFPYYDLDNAVEVARVVHEKAGGACTLGQLASLLEYSGVSNGAFRTRVSAAKMFGVIEDADNKRIAISSRGLAIVAPVGQAAADKAKVDAFLAVDLFKKVYERFGESALPAEVGLKNLLANEYQVVAARVAPTVRIMLDSAQQAGFFQVAGNRSKMVMPLGVSAVSTEKPEPGREEKVAEEPRKGGGGNGGGGGGYRGPEIDPAILGLLQRLPPGGTPLSTKRRKALIDAFTATVGFIYPEAEGDE